MDSLVGFLCIARLSLPPECSSMRPETTCDVCTCSRKTDHWHRVSAPSTVNDKTLEVTSPCPGSVWAQNESQALSTRTLAWLRASLVCSLPGHGQEDNGWALTYIGGRPKKQTRNIIHVFPVNITVTKFALRCPTEYCLTPFVPQIFSYKYYM